MTKPSDVIVAKALAAEEQAKEEKAKEKGKLITKEHRETGSLSWEVYSSYIKAAGGMKFFATLMCCYMLSETARVCSSWWLGIWSADSLDTTVTVYMAVYFCLTLFQTLMSASSSLIGAFGSVEASRQMHDSMVSRMLRYVSCACWCRGLWLGGVGVWVVCG